MSSIHLDGLRDASHRSGLLDVKQKENINRMADLVLRFKWFKTRTDVPILLTKFSNRICWVFFLFEREGERTPPVQKEEKKNLN